jgi:hypothetical protein
MLGRIPSCLWGRSWRPNRSSGKIRPQSLKNIPGTGDQDDHQDDQWEPPALAPKLFRNPMAYAQFVGAFQSGELTREWAHALSQHGGGMTPQETWAYEEWFDKTHRITAPGNYEKLIEDNIRRYQEEHGLAPVEEA